MRAYGHSYKKCIGHHVGKVYTIMIPFSNWGADLLLVAQGRVLVGEGYLLGRGCSFLFFYKTCKQEKST